ncbi:MAG: cobalamin-dependent protein [Aeriscardovia sp.]|nr:cobalamin-dependent protein [Aeriscardovia sp.]MBR2756212.1 cobalamin-dependent protein [Lachnospiraceae bacterium]
MVDLTTLAESVGELEEEEMLDSLKKVMEDGGGQAAEAMAECQKGLDIVGERFETGEYFISDLVFAGELMSEAVKVLKPALAGETGTNMGKMILCTVEGDLHDIGKNIVRGMLEAGGFEVIDLGIDTPAEKVVETAKENNIKIVALSGVLTIAIGGMRRTIALLKESGLDVKVIIGGAPVNEAVKEEVGADAWAYNPQDTVRICQTWATA